MKKLLLLLLSTVVFSACSGEEANNDDCATEPGADGQPIVGCELPEIEDLEEDDNVSVLPVPTVDVTEVRDYLFTASSTLVDDTNIGFNYEAAMVSDADFSTAWCRASGDKEPSIVFDFSRPVKAEKFGIVPGFARDEKIYNQNNRLKKVTLFFDDKNPMEVELKDAYGMQFVELGGKEFSNIKLVVNDVYKGSKYDDTCVSEWDFSSDYVQKGDSVAAMDFYVKEKKDDALRPYDIVGKVTLNDFAPNKCKEPEGTFPDTPGSLENTSGALHSGYFDLDANIYYFSGEPVYLTGYVNEFGKEGDLVQIKWYTEMVEFPEGLGGPVIHKGWKLVENQEDVPVVKGCNGKLYVFGNVKNIAEGIGSNHRADIYSKDKLIGNVKFYFAQ